MTALVGGLPAHGDEGTGPTGHRILAPMTAGHVEDLPIDGIVVHLRRFEPARRVPTAPPMLLVHGLGANAVSWLPVGQGLADRRGAPVIAPDLVGFGYTRATTERATIQRNATLVAEVLERLGPAVLVGNSMGGAIAVKVAARWPDLVEAVVLVNPALRPPIGSPQWRSSAVLAPMVLPAFGARLVASRARELGPERLVDGTLELVLDDPARLDPAVREQLITIARTRMGYPEAPRAYADAASSLFWYLARNFDRDLAAVLRARAGLVVFGERDRLVHVTSAHALCARHPTIALEVLDGLGHAPQLESPERFVEVVDAWLRAVLGR